MGMGRQTKSVRKSVHDWRYEEKVTKGVFDDGTMTYFWRAHTLTVLFLLISVLVYVAVIEPTPQDFFYNTKRGLIAVLYAFVLVGVTVTPDGPFLRPHPAVWRFFFILSIVYELALVFLLFQTAKDAREILWHLDNSLGAPLAEKDYGGNCRIYDWENAADPFHNLKDKMDVFVPAHFLGWWCKMLILRDIWVCWVISVMFEILEYTLEHQLPNFSECWWDHWVVDALLCNGLGIYCGLKTLQLLSIRTYHWRGLWNIPTYRGKLGRILAQFGPYSWRDFDWKPTSSLGRWIFTLSIISMFLLTELNTFYMKFVLWIPPDNWLNGVRLVMYLFWGAVALRETFQYLDDPNCNKFGRQAWLIVAITVSEFFVVLKFGWETVTIPLPRHIAICWIFALTALVGVTIWKFFIPRRSEGGEHSDEEETDSEEDEISFDKPTDISDNQEELSSSEQSMNLGDFTSLRKRNLNSS